MSKDPDDYLHNEDPKPLIPPPPLLTVPWARHERFLLFLDTHGLGALSSWMAAPEGVHAIFHALLSNGCDPFDAAELFTLSYCAPPGTYRVETSPHDEGEEYNCFLDKEKPDALGICAAEDCPKKNCKRRADVIAAAFDEDPPQVMP
jgi:hypothetical protein